MKKIYTTLLIFLICISYTFSQCNIGNETETTDFNFPLPLGAHILWGHKHTLNQLGTLNSINLISADTGKNVQMAVFDDNGGAPGNLISSSAITSLSIGMVSLPVTPILLPAGDYWIMAIYEEENTMLNSNPLSTNLGYALAMTFGTALPTDGSAFSSIGANYEFLYYLNISCGNTLSTDTLKKHKTSIYPNPSEDYIYVANMAVAESYQIFDVLGKQISSGKINFKIDITNLINGIYFLKIDNEVFKIIKK